MENNNNLTPENNNIFWILALIFWILSFFIPFLLWWFLLIWWAIILWIIWIKKNQKWLSTWWIILWVISLIFSPSLWILLASFINKYEFNHKVNNTNVSSNVKTEETKSKIDDSKTTKSNENANDWKKTTRFVIEKWENWIINLYTYELFDEAKIQKFADKYGYNPKDIRILSLSKEETFKKAVLNNQTNIKEKEKIQKFFDNINKQDMNIVYDSSFSPLIDFSITIDDLTKYEDVIKILSEYKMFVIDIKKS